MGITLTSKTIRSTYQGLLKLSDNDSLNTVYKTVTDGFGNDSALRVSSIAVSAVKLYSEMSAADILADANGSVVVTRAYLGQFSYEVVTNKGVADGYVPLDSNALIPAEFIPAGAGAVDSVNGLSGDVQIDLAVDLATSTLTLTGGASADLSLLGNYVHDQGVSSSVWSVSHGLGKYPSVMAVDSANSVVVGEIEYIDQNNIVITFNSGFSGYAYLN
mgnify:CR=1 FL=1